MMIVNKLGKSCLLLAIAVVFLNIFLYGLFLRFDITIAHPWRQTDSQAEITNYAKGVSDFLHPVVNAPVTQWGPGLIEIPLPIFQYASAQLSNLIRSPVRSLTQNSYAGFIQLPAGLKASDYSERKYVKNDKVHYQLDFILRSGLEYRLASLLRPSMMDYLHIYLVAKKPLKQKTCVHIINRRSDQHISKNYWEQVSDYCYQADNTPILYIPLRLGKNEFEFIFGKSVAPKILSSELSLFSDSKYASLELFSARIVNILLLSATAMILACTFFPAGWFRIAAGLSVSLLPAFGYFAYFIHEEILAFLFIAIFLWTLFKKALTSRWVIFASIALAVATALRPYYGLYGLMLASLAFCRDGLKIFLKPVYYFAALITVLPATLWYSWTQYLVSQGADTIAIFSNRIVLSSLLDVGAWASYLKFFVYAHFTLPVLLTFIVIFLATAGLIFKKIIKLTLNIKVFLMTGALINLIIFPLVFDSAYIHNYYQFPITAFIILAALISVYQLRLVIKNRLHANLLCIVVFGIIFISCSLKVLYDFTVAMAIEHDAIDFSVMGGIVGELFESNDKVVLLDSGGPQIYGMTNRNGRRDAGYYSAYPFKGINDLNRYLVQWYGPLSTYNGLASCETFVHRAENFTIYTMYLSSQYMLQPHIRYTLATYPNCEIIKFIK